MPRRAPSIAGRTIRALARFGADSRGGASIEMTLWIVLFLTIFFVVVDVAVLYLGYSRMLEAARETSRALAIRTILPFEDDVKAHALAQLGPGHTVRIPAAYVASGGLLVGEAIPIEISASNSTMAVFGFFEPVLPTLRAVHRQQQEPVSVVAPG